MKHPIVHTEISAKDPKEAAHWYKDVFGWELTEYPEMNYYTANYGDENAGVGFNPVGDENPAGTVVNYISTDDLAATVGKIKDKGGTVILESQDIPGVGTMAMFKDPTGNLMALLQPAPMEEQA